MLASPGLSNEAFWLLQRLTPRLPAALLARPRAARGRSQGAIANLVRCKTIVLVGLDAWNDLPVLALWIRKAVAERARKLVVLGAAQRPLARHRPLADRRPARLAIDLRRRRRRASRHGRPRRRTGGRGGRALAHRRGCWSPVASRGRGRLRSARRRRLALPATTALVGAPCSAPTAAGRRSSRADLLARRSRRELRPRRQSWRSATSTGASCRPARSRARRWPLRQVPADDARIDVVLPMAHAYERQGIADQPRRARPAPGRAARRRPRRPAPTGASWPRWRTRLGGPASPDRPGRHSRPLSPSQHPALRRRLLRAGGPGRACLRSLIDVVRSLIIIVALLTGMAYMTWFERRVISRLQVRIGPNRVGPTGLLQPLADALKLFFKEDIRPAMADRLLYPLAPGISLFAALAAFAVIPIGAAHHASAGVGSTLIIQDMPVALLYLIGGQLAGRLRHRAGRLGLRARSTRCSGALRGGAQVVSYELVLGLALVGVVLVSGTLSLGDIVRQAGALGAVRAAAAARLPALLHAPPSPRRTARRSTCPRPSRSWSRATTPSTAACASRMYYIAEYVNVHHGVGDRGDALLRRLDRARSTCCTGPGGCCSR